MTTSERKKIADLLERSGQEFLDAVADLDQTQWMHRPAEDRWSAGEVAEHVLLTEDVILDAIHRMLASPPDPDWQAHTADRTAELERVLPDRSQRRVCAPGMLVPQTARPHAEAIAAYQHARARTLAFAREVDAPLHTHTLPNPFFGVLNAYQWLLYIPLHNLRHNQQILEIKTAPGFPR